ncbi:MAG: hypothetical protein V3U46_10250 [Acidimicrobiia bacterium]
MSSTQYGCYQSIDLCAIRASTLDSDGSAPAGPTVNGAAYNLRPISLGRSPVVSTGETFEQRDGCGRICVSITDPDVTTSETLTLTLCQLDLELISILTGADILLDASANAIGVEAPDPAVDLPVVEFNSWTKAYDGSSQVAAPRDYYHWVWPKTQWNIGDWTIERGILSIVITAKATANANLGSGTFNDLPGAGIQQFFGVFLATDIPDPDVSPYSDDGLSCGFVDTPANAS